ncbi:MAG: hypothetical protein COA43_12380 [Robiginitomaculum sp.]|nr:MAG: hypothetical protein COA43_12380 [Robiginitomaculum sp.]
MHIIGVIIALATAVFWIGKAAGGVNNIANAASTLQNMPRRNRFRKNASKRGIDLIDNPLEAATILMVCTARLSDYAHQHDGLISDSAKGNIVAALRKHMQISIPESEDLLTHMSWASQDLALPEVALVPMANILTKNINRAEALDLSDMLTAISHADGTPNTDQESFVAHFRDRVGLNG